MLTTSGGSRAISARMEREETKVKVVRVRQKRFTPSAAARSLSLKEEVFLIISCDAEAHLRLSYFTESPSKPLYLREAFTFKRIFSSEIEAIAVRELRPQQQQLLLIGQTRKVSLNLCSDFSSL